MLNSLLKARAAALLQRTGEDVVIVDGSTTRTVKAIVTRLPPGLGRDGNKLDARAVLDVANDAVLGIDTATVDLGRLRVRMAIRLGGAVRDWSIAMGDDADGWSDPGMVTIQVSR